MARESKAGSRRKHGRDKKRRTGGRRTAPRIDWADRARVQVPEEMQGRVEAELAEVFASAESIAIQNCFHGYSANHDAKLVLCVEVHSPEVWEAHVVKLGDYDTVACDYTNWLKGAGRRHIPSRIFLSVSLHALPDRRAAVVYEDAHTICGAPLSEQAAEPLEDAVRDSIKAADPDPASIERVIRQIYGDLYAWFYQTASEDVDRAAAFYTRKLNAAPNAWATERWRLELRRDAIWLLCSRDKPACPEPPRYLDPYDYVCWALASKRVPPTLVGRSHGDLHARNILVGVRRGEAEYPAVFDYGDMGKANALAWDFVKLETELKVRLLPPLSEDEAANRALIGILSSNRELPDIAEASPAASVEQLYRRGRARELAFAARFETLMAGLTNKIHWVADPAQAHAHVQRDMTDHPALNRAVTILMRIRREAALCLGDWQPQRADRELWRDEYYFALAVYGLATAKFRYTPYESAFALVAAGIAAAQIEDVQAEIRREIDQATAPGKKGARRRPGAYPSYHVPLAQVHTLWREQRSRREAERALTIIEPAANYFHHAVPILQEYALTLAEVGRHREARELLEPLQDACGVFGDSETLSRIGRTYKDLGDRVLEDYPVELADIGSHPSYTWYENGRARYKEAFDIIGDYYPGINAATLALMCGHPDESRELAERVIELCRIETMKPLSAADRFWVLASQGEASLLLHRKGNAARDYNNALQALPKQHVGMAKTAYKQVCRLWWALGQDVVGPVVKVFDEGPFLLPPGPLRNCGLGHRRVGQRGGAGIRKTSRPSRRRKEHDSRKR